METAHTCDVALAGDLNRLTFPGSYIEAHRSLSLETVIVSSSPAGLGKWLGDDKGRDVRYVNSASASPPVKAQLLILVWPGAATPLPVIARRAVVVGHGKWRIIDSRIRDGM